MDLKSYDGYIIHSNNIIHNSDKNFYTLLNLDTSKDITGKSVDSFIGEKQYNKLINKCNQLNNDDEKLGIELTLDSGKKLILLSNLINNTDRIKTTFIDISQVDEKLNLSLKNMALDKAPIGITIADISLEDEPLIYVNDGFMNMVKYDYNEIIGQNCRFLQGEKTDESQVKKMRDAIDSKNSVTVTVKNYKKNGCEFWNRITLIPIENNFGEINYYLGFQEDISESKKYEQEKNIFEEHAESSKNAMFITDKNWKIEYINPKFIEKTGYNNDIIGKSPDLLKPENINNSEEYSELKEAVEKGRNWEGKLMRITKSDELYYVKETLTPIKDDNGNITNYTVIQEDITEYKLNKQVLDVLHRVLRHNLRTSINIIDGYTDVLESDCTENQRKKSVKAIREKTEEMNNISNKMKQIRNLIKGYDEPQPFKLSNINTIVQPHRKRKNTIISVNPSDIEHRQVKYGNIFNITLNEALNNAFKNNNQKVKRINISIELFENNIAKIDVEDNNKHINKDDWKVIKSGTETPLEHLDGIELWVLYWSVTAIGGRIKLRQKRHKGNIMTMYIPLIPED